MKAVILAGGRGERLRPLTDRSPKPMIPLLDKPLLAYNLELLKKQGIEEVTLTVCFMKEKIINYIGDGARFGMCVSYIEEEEPLGTAGSLFLHAGRFNEPFVVLSGDSLTNIPIRDAICFHKEKGAMLTIVTVDVEETKDFGICLANSDNRLISFVEKPSGNRSFSKEANTGIYIIEPAFFKKYHFDGYVDFAHDIFPALLRDQERIFIYHADAYWQDVGNPKQHALAESRLRKGIPGITRKVKSHAMHIKDFSADYLKSFTLSHSYAVDRTNSKK